MKLGQLLGKTFNFLGRALDSTEKVFDVTDNLLDSAVALTDDVKQDALFDSKVAQKTRNDKLKELGLV